MVQQYSLNQILKLFDSTKDTDHDLRFMALNDLNRIVTESPQQFPNYNRTTLIYANILIQSLDDQHSEVQNQAVKCFIPLAPLLKSEDVLKFILQLMSSEGENSSLIISSVYTMAIKAILENLNISRADEGHVLVDSLLPKLLNYGSLLSKIDVIEILNDTIENLGRFFTPDQVAKTYELLIRVEFNAENTISKASIIGLGRIIKFVDERQLSSMLTLTNSGFKSRLERFKSSEDEHYHTYTLRLSILTVFFKEGNSYITSILPNVLDVVFLNLFFANQEDNDEDDFDRKFKIDQVRDDALLCLEVIVQNIGYETISPYIVQILNLCNQLLNYDPFHTDNGDDQNYSDEDLDDGDEYDISDNEEFDYEPEDEEENDYDLSWSLRKNSLKLIGKIVENYPLALRQIYALKIFDNLIPRLSDASANVSNEATITLTKIISSTSRSGNYYAMTFYDFISNNIKKRRSDDNADIDIVMDESDIDPHESLVSSSELLCDKIVNKLLVEKNTSRFNAIFDLLSQLTDVLDGLPSDYLYKAIQKINALNLTTSIDLLKFFSQLFQSNKLDKFGDQTGFLLRRIVEATNDSSNYELSLEGLNTASEFFKAISNDIALDHGQILQLGQIIAQKATSKNYSNEIKQRCLHSLSELITNYHLFSSEELQSLLVVYEQSLEYESLVEVSITQLTKIIRNISVRFDSIVLERILAKFVSLLNLRSSEVKSLVLECLLSLSETSIQLPSQVRTKIIETLMNLLKQNSLLGKQISECLIVIGNLTSTLDSQIWQIEDLLGVIDLIIPNVNQIDQDSILEFSWKVSANIGQQQLFDIVSEKFSKEDSKDFNAIFPGILASVVLALQLDEIVEKSEDFVKNFNGDVSSRELEFQVLFLGFIGKKTSLKSGLDPFLKIIEIPEDTSLKTAAFSSIGNISTYNISSYLPVLLDQLSTNDLLSTSLRKILEVKIQNGEIIPSTQGITEEEYTRIWNLLLEIPLSKRDLKISHAELNLIAECLTLIALLDISKIDRLIETIDSTTSLTLKYTIVSTVKYFLNYATILSQQSISFDRYLSKLLEKASLLIFNDNLQLKQTSVQALITSLHNKPLLALPILFQLLSTIMEKELVIRKEYIDTIQIGPFKHKIDNALDLRKSIYEMVYTLMTTIENSNTLKNNSVQQSLNYFDILKISIEKGLKDDIDVIQLSSLIIAKVVNLKPQIIFKDLELLTAFKERALKIINKKIKETDTKQVMEKQKESVRSIQTLITNIDNIIQKNGLQGGDFEDWRKFAFVNGIK